MSAAKLLIGLAGLACLALAAPSAQAIVLLAPGSTWEYTFQNPTASPTWNTSTGGWTTGAAPFGTSTSGDFKYNTFWQAGTNPNTDELWVRTSLDLTGIDLASVEWFIGVDNGFTLFVNGVQITKQNAEGPAIRWENVGNFGANLINGVNVVALALEDHGGATGFDMQITGEPTVVPEPATMALLGLGLSGVAIVRRRMRK